MSTTTGSDSGIPVFPGGNEIGKAVNVITGIESTYSDVIDRGPMQPFEWTVNDKDKTYLVPGHATVSPFNSATMSTMSGESRQELQQAMSAQLGLSGSYGAFRGEFDGYFDSSSQLSSECKYSVAQIHSTMARLTYSAPITTGSLLPEVEEHWDALAAKGDYVSIFEQYGTHVVRSAVVGARLDQAISMNLDESNSAVDFGAQVSARYKIWNAGISAHAAMDYSSLDSRFSSSINVKMSSQGGNSSLVSEFSEDATAYGAWLASAMNNPEIISYLPPPSVKESEGGSAGLLEICNLVSDKSYFNDMKTAFENYMGTTTIEVVGKAGANDDGSPRFGYITVGATTAYEWADPAIFGFMLVVLDAETLKPKLTPPARCYYTCRSPEVQDILASDLMSFTSDDIILLASGFGGWGDGITPALIRALMHCCGVRTIPRGDEPNPDWRYLDTQPCAVIARPEVGGQIVISADSRRPTSLKADTGLRPLANGEWLDIERVEGDWPPTVYAASSI